VDTWEEFEKALDENPGFVSAHWDGTSATELAIKEKNKSNYPLPPPLNNPKEAGKSILTGQPSTQRVLFGRAY